MYIVIAKIMSTDERNIEACRIIDTTTNRKVTLSLKNIKKLINSGEHIIGFKTVQINDYKHQKVRTNIVKERSKFSFNRVPEINGAGDLVNKEDADLKIVYGWKGFAEAKKYYCYDYDGNTTIIPVEQFKESVKNRKINGAIINNKGKLVIMNDLNNEMETIIYD